MAELEGLQLKLDQHKEAALMCRYMLDAMKRSDGYTQTEIDHTLQSQKAIAAKINLVYAQIADAKERGCLYRSVIKSFDTKVGGHV